MIRFAMEATLLVSAQAAVSTTSGLDLDTAARPKAAR
jgi:hypothetical protein